MGLRGLLLVYVVIILPLFFAPYYAFIRDQGVTFTFALFFAMVVGVLRGPARMQFSLCEINVIFVSPHTEC